MGAAFCFSKSAVELGHEQITAAPSAILRGGAPSSKGRQDEDQRRLASKRKEELDEARAKCFWEGLETDDQSDEHSLDWINAIIEVGYPRFNKAMQADILPMVQQEVTSKAEALSGVSAITITSFDFGVMPPVVGPLDVSRRNVATGNGQAIEIRCKLRWESDCNINMTITTSILSLQKEFSMGLTKLTVSGEVTVLLCPILKVLPCVAAVQVYMVSPPTLDFELQGSFLSMGEGMAQLLRGFVRNGLLKAFQQQIVEPNRMMIMTPVVRLFQGKLEMNAGTMVDDQASLKHPRPEILAEIGAIEAKGLTAKDWSMTGASSDPYAIIRLGDRDFRTKTVKKNVNPVWGKEGFGDFLVFNMRQQVQVEVQDEDTVQDDLIGRLPPLTFAEFAKRSQEDWYDIFEANPAQLASDQGRLVAGEPRTAGRGRGDEERAATGQVKLGYTFFAFSSDPETVKKPPKKKTKGTSFLQVQIKCLRGLTEEYARGAKVNLKVDGESHYTKGSKYVQSKSRSDADATSQRLAEHLILEEKEDEATVAKVSGLDLETVRAIIRQKPSFTCRWFEGLDLILQDAMHTRIEVEVELKGGRTLKAPQPLIVAHLLQAPDMTFETSMRLEDATDTMQSKGVFATRRKPDRAHTDGMPGKRASHHGQTILAQVMDKVLPASRDSENEHPEVFDLDIKFSLYGLIPYTREPLELQSPGTSPRFAI